MVADNVEVMVLSAAARKVAIHVETIAATTAGLICGSSLIGRKGDRGLYPGDPWGSRGDCSGVETMVLFPCILPREFAGQTE